MMLYRSLDVVLPQFRRIFSRHGLTEQQWRILRALWEADEQPLLALAESTLLPSPSLVGIIDRLERDGLVARKRSATDRRVVHICLTATGRTLERQVMPDVDKVYAAIDTRLTRQEWQTLHTILTKLQTETRAWESKQANNT